MEMREDVAENSVEEAKRREHQGRGWSKGPAPRYSEILGIKNMKRLAAQWNMGEDLDQIALDERKTGGPCPSAELLSLTPSKGIPGENCPGIHF